MKRIKQRTKARAKQLRTNRLGQKARQDRAYIDNLLNDIFSDLLLDGAKALSKEFFARTA